MQQFDKIPQQCYNVLCHQRIKSLRKKLSLMKNKLPRSLSPLFIVLAGVLWGAMGIFVRRFNSYGVEAMSIVFIRALFTSLTTASVCLIADPSQLRVRLRDLWIFAGMGIMSIVFFNYCYFTAISLMSLSAAAILLYTSPVFVAIMSAIFFKERITARKLLAIALSLMGLSLVTGIIGGGSTVTPMGILFGIGSAVGYALYSIFGRAAIDRGYKPLTSTTWGFMFAALCSLFLADLPAIGSMVSAAPSMIGYSLLFSALISVIPYFLYNLGLSGTENSKAAVIASLEPAAATVIGIVLYKEYPTVLTILGIILVFAALVLCIDFAPPKGSHHEGAVRAAGKD